MTQTIVPKELLTATPGGLSLLVVSGGADGQVLTQQADGTYAPEAVSAGIGGSTGSTDNRVLRADGTGGSTVQGSAVTIDDSGYLSAARLQLGTTSSFAMIKQGTSTEAGNVPGAVIKDATDAGYMALHARRLTASDGLIGCWNGSEWNGWVIFADVLVAKNTGRIAWSHTSSSLGGTEDLKMVRVSAGLGSICGNAGLKVQNFAGNADADLTASAVVASGLMCCGVYTFATVPSASSNTGKFLRISDRAQKHAYSDGTNWRFFGDDAIIS